MRLIALCETHNRYRFFKRFLEQLTVRSGTLIVLSNRLSIVLKARQDGLDARLIRGGSGRFGEMPRGDDFYEVQKRLLEPAVVETLWNKSQHFISNFLKNENPDYFLIWNGSSLVSRAIVDVLKREGVATIFFEIGNFPEKLFVDPEGVNVRSWFSKSYKTIYHSFLDMEEFSRWRDDYLAGKRSAHTVQQVKTSMSFNWSYPIDLIGFWFLSSPYSEKPDVLRRTWNFVRSKMVDYEFDEFSLCEDRPYLFFPMQVSTDSQILWNSSLDNFSAIKKAIEVAKENNCDLVVKPHPADIDRVAVKEIEKLKNEYGFFFVDRNTFELIEGCRGVVTINSTVGMEALLCSKPVTTLGLAMFVDFTEEDMAFYLQKYLLDIDFFSDAPLTDEQFTAVLERADVPEWMGAG